MLRHKTRERFSCFGTNIFCQYEINPGINSQGMLSMGAMAEGKLQPCTEGGAEIQS